MTHLCKQCNADISGHHGKAIYCFACSAERRKVRIADPSRKREPHPSPIRRNGQWVCLTCAEPVHQFITHDGKKRRPSTRCQVCAVGHHLWSKWMTGRLMCATAVSKAKASGELAPLDGQLCADCARPAQCYDHRDYSRPLDVEPVCFSCNVIRGHAKPIDQGIVLGMFSRLISAPSESQNVGA